MYTLEEGSLFGFMGPLFGFMGLGFLKGKTSFLKVKLVPSRHQKKSQARAEASSHTPGNL